MGLGALAAVVRAYMATRKFHHNDAKIYIFV